MGDVKPTDIVFSPPQIARLGTRYIEKRIEEKGSGIPLGLKSIDADFLPAVAGDLISIVARPGCGKTGFMLRWARSRAKDLMDMGIEDRAVIYITYEQHIEDLHAFHVASESHIDVGNMARGLVTDDQIGLIHDKGVRRASLPLWFIGHSQERRKRRPRLTMDALYDALYAVEYWNSDGVKEINIDMIFLDYLQRIPLDSGSETKVVGLDNHINSLKDAALTFLCPLVMGVQAKREVDSYSLPIPQMDDGQWCSSIEQVSDKVFGLVRPRKYRKEGETFGSMVVQGHTQMLVALLKQKLGKDNTSYWVRFAPEYNELDEAEVDTVNLTDKGWGDGKYSKDYTV